MSENACRRRFLFSVVAFAFICIAISAAILGVVFRWFTSSADCVSCRSYFHLFSLLGIVTAVLFAAGLLKLLLRPVMLCYKRRHINTTPQVVVSLIPTEDLEKSASPILPFVRVPHRLPFLETSSIDSLPDYFTIVQNADEVYSSVDADVWTENVTETPTPSYEEALEMTTFAA